MAHKCCCDKPGHCPWHDSITTADSFLACQEGFLPIASKPCIYLGSLTDHHRRRVDLPIYECRQHGLCTLTPNRGGLPNCKDCKQYHRLDNPKLSNDFLDPLLVTTRDGNRTHALRNHLAGGSAFLVCGGPSINQLDYKRLSERGVFSLGVNNVCGYVPVSAFVCSDPPSKFHSSIFFDPKIIKLLPTPKLRENRGKLRRKIGEAKFEWIDKITTGDCPNTWGFERRSWMAPDETWFTEPGAPWGNHEAGTRKTKQPKTVNTMLLGLRMLQYLGARRIFLLGVDFKMDPLAELHANYSFGEQRDESAINSNNNQYQVVNNWLIQLRPIFEKFGFYTYNCNPTSCLRAFDYVPFEAALECCRGRVEKEPYDLEGWYAK